jgi:hypothetical protein
LCVRAPLQYNIGKKLLPLLKKAMLH